MIETGGARNQAALALRRYWVERVRDLPGIEILTLEKPARYSAVTSFRLPGLTDYPRAQKRSQLLLERMLT